MPGYGFIQDKLEIKFLILYISARVIAPVPFDTMLELTLCDDAIDYFDFSECLADLVKTEHLTLSDEKLYAITDKGRRNSEICESNIPFSVRRRCDGNLEECNRRLRRENQVRSLCRQRKDGAWVVTLDLDDDFGELMHLHLTVVKEDLAKEFARRFTKEPQVIYGQVVNLLLSAQKPEHPDTPIKRDEE
jgi:hypothetical protein